MSIQPSACPICGGKGWVGKSFREMGDWITFAVLDAHPELAYKECLVCNADGSKPLVFLRPVRDDEPITNPAFLAQMEAVHGKQNREQAESASQGQAEEVSSGPSEIGILQTKPREAE